MWLQDQISVGLITDRANILDALVDAGFDIPRAGKAYLTAQDPDTGERWRWRLNAKSSMKTGKLIRLSEKLNAELDTIRQGSTRIEAQLVASDRTGLKTKAPA